MRTAGQDQRWAASVASMTTTEAAAALQVTPRGLFRLIDRGDLRAFRVDGAMRLRGEDVEIYPLEQP